ncbi:MAG: hypothetical protein R3B13_09315 [Polyangiaceae bacterium]
MEMGLMVVVIGGSLLFTFVIIGISAYIFYRVFKKMGDASRLRQIGIPASAQILSLSDTGVTINDNPQVALALAIQSPHHGAYQVQTTSIISRLAIPRVQPGMTVPVKIDPQNPNNVVLDI